MSETTPGQTSEAALQPRSPTVEWQVCGICNYDCSYCIQKKSSRVGFPDAANVEQFLAFFETLPGTWEIKMTGGEPFAFAGFRERIVPGLIARTRHTVSVLTNLSADQKALQTFATTTYGRVGVVSASLHLEHIDLSEFAQKAAWFRDQLATSARFVVNSVAVPGQIARLQEARAALGKYGLKLFPQIMKQAGGVADYAENDTTQLVQLLGKRPSSRDANVAPSYRGRLCWVGVDYFVLTQKGDAWSCRTAKRFGQGYLGNVLYGEFKRAAGPLPCSYDICPCTVPANRGMIEGIHA
jgi:organic radical activating enzyme